MPVCVLVLDELLVCVPVYEVIVTPPSFSWIPVHTLLISNSGQLVLYADHYT